MRGRAQLSVTAQICYYYQDPVTFLHSSERLAAAPDACHAHRRLAPEVLDLILVEQLL